MSKIISINMWQSIVPDKMYNSWIKKGWISKGDHDLQTKDYGNKYFYAILEKGTNRKSVYSLKAMKTLISQDWVCVTHKTNLSKAILKQISTEVNEWYMNVFKYVTEWFNKNGYIQIKKGSFNTGFCAESNPKSDVVKNWGAPLADKGNKVEQIKEKFGFITVYLSNLSKWDKIKIGFFAKFVEWKFDCKTSFN